MSKWDKDKVHHEVDVEMTKSFFNRKTCERCRQPLDGARTMSMFNTETICVWCKEVEELHPDYEKARKADKYQYRKGNRYFGGIGVDTNELKIIERGC